MHGKVILSSLLACASALVFPVPMVSRRMSPCRQKETARFMIRRTEAAQKISRLHTRIVGKPVAPPVALTVEDDVPKKRHFVRKFFSVLGKSLLLGFVIQPALASAAPPGLQYLAYLGFGREEGELYKTQTTYHLAAPFIIAGVIAARATLNERHQAEKEKIRKANERMKEAEREYINVDGEAENDVDIMSELRQRASNMTNATTASAYNKPPPTPPPPSNGGPPPPTRPRSPPPSSPSTGKPTPSARPSPPSSTPGGPKTASADDVARLMRMMGGNSSKSS